MKHSPAFKRIIIVFLCLFSTEVARSESVVVPNEVAFSKQDRIMILAPHPDDESLCCGGVIQKSVKENIPTQIVYLTHGDNNEWSFLISEKKPILTSRQAKRLGMMRSREALDAAAVLGIQKENVVFLGYPDSGTLSIWNERWRSSEPHSGFLTKSKKVPYQNAFRPGADYVSEEILQDLKSVIKSFNPTQIFVSHPADLNADHRALYFFTRAALWDLNLNPKIYPYLIHYKKWPKPRGYFPTKQMWIPAPLMSRIEWKQVRLTETESDVKYAAVLKHHTQVAYSKKFMTSFVRINENFGDFRDIPLKFQTESQDNRTYLDFSDPDDSVVQKGTVMLDRENLIIDIDLNGMIGGALKFDLSVYGHRKDVRFAKMPKIHIRCGITDCEVYDANTRQESHEIRISREAGKTVFMIPIRDLGYPQRVMIGMSTLLGDQTTKLLPGRIFEIQSDPIQSEL